MQDHLIGLSGVERNFWPNSVRNFISSAKFLIFQNLLHGNKTFCCVSVTESVLNRGSSISDTESTPQELVTFLQFANSCTKQSKRQNI